MKISILFICVLLGVVCVSAGPDFALIRKVYKKCLEQEKITNSEATEYVKARKWKKVMCLQACILEHLGILESDGTLDLVELEFFMNKTMDALVQISIDCALNVDGDRCSIVENFENCIIENSIGDTIL